jgi:hypothetical protein
MEMVYDTYRIVASGILMHPALARTERLSEFFFSATEDEERHALRSKMVRSWSSPLSR